MADLTPDDIERVVQLVNSGRNYEDLDPDVLFGVIALAQGNPEKLREAVIALRKKGWTDAKIAERAGVNEVTPWRWRLDPEERRRHRGRSKASEDEEPA